MHETEFNVWMHKTEFNIIIIFEVPQMAKNKFEGFYMIMGLKLLAEYI